MRLRMLYLTWCMCNVQHGGPGIRSSGIPLDSAEESVHNRRMVGAFDIHGRKGTLLNQLHSARFVFPLKKAGVRSAHKSTRKNARKTLRLSACLPMIFFVVVWGSLNLGKV